MKRHILPVLILLAFGAQAQKLKKADKVIVDNLKAHVSFLADDRLEGRRAGSPGEKLAMDYIASEFSKSGLQPKGENGGYFQTFPIDDGRQVGKNSFFQVNGQDLKQGVDFFPLPYSPNSGVVEGVASVSLSESKSPWFRDLGDDLMNNKDNPHFDLVAHVKDQIRNAADKGASALILYNSSTLPDNITYQPKDRTDPAAIPVFYLKNDSRLKYLPDASAAYDLKLRSEVVHAERQAHNVVGYIDNKAATTVVLGAHFDHLGYGEDGNSRSVSTERLIHNGADDNASGSSALLELSRLLVKSKYRNNNYLFVSFSGEEMGLFGSKYYVEHSGLDLGTINYMINMDMVGRLNDSTHTLTVGGFGTSPAWNGILFADKKSPFQIRIDSSGVGPSDHTSFYLKNIPVLFFFTGLHADYHKPTDDADKINYVGEMQIVKFIYSLVDNANNAGKLAFNKTRDAQTSTSARFSVSLGIMPDYTFSGAGVRVDGVSEGKAAQKAGVKAGDIVTQLGEYKVNSMESYMQTLGKFKKGDTTKVHLKRGNDEVVLDVTF
jgi:aminopeptidase YwaD